MSASGSNINLPNAKLTLNSKEAPKTDAGTPEATDVTNAVQDNKTNSLEAAAEANSEPKEEPSSFHEPTKTSFAPDASKFGSLRPPTPPRDLPRGRGMKPTSGVPPTSVQKPPPGGR